MRRPRHRAPHRLPIPLLALAALAALAACSSFSGYDASRYPSASVTATSADPDTDPLPPATRGRMLDPRMPTDAGR